MYDAIIVGARCAGSPTAMLLARKGYRVLLVDRARFPSDIMSTHFIWQSGTARLHRWGLLEKVRSTGCPPVTKLTLDFGDFILTGCPPAANGGVREAFCPRRTVLDKILIDAAAEAGAEVRQGFSVQEILWDNGRVTGIRGTPKGGAAVSEHARITIGADGLHSRVAQAVQAPKTIERPIASCGYYSYWSGVPVAGATLYIRPRRTIITLPTNNALTLVIVIAAYADFQQYRANIEGTYLAGIDLVPALAARVRAGRRVERFVGGGEFLNFFRKPFGPGWALVGDAGYHKDPYTAQGISDAFRDSEFLVEALDDGFSGRRSFEEALADYERRRNEAALPAFESCCQRAALEPPPPEMQQLLSALRGNQEQIDRFIGTDAGTVSYADFFSQENMQRIMEAASSEVTVK